MNKEKSKKEAKRSQVLNRAQKTEFSQLEKILSIKVKYRYKGFNLIFL